MDGREQIVECVPNFSEGRKRGTVARLVEAANSVAGAAALGVHTDPDHHRTVVTFAGAPEAVLEAAVRVVARAAELIDLREHRGGVHPRLGAADVVPFVPIRNASVENCVEIAHRAGRRIADELGLPVYFYERAALSEARRKLEHVRGEGFDRWASETELPIERAPDLGPRRLHPSAGAVIVGARPFLIAYNVNLRTADASVARRVARAVRARDGGLPCVKALGLKLDSRDVAQVSMNLTDYKITSVATAFDAVRAEAARLGVEVEGSEVVGLVPRDALPPDAEQRLLIENFSPDLILENRLRDALAGE